MGTARTVAKNSAMIFISSMAIKLLALLFAVYAVRYLGAENYGKYAFVFSFMTVFTILSSMGIDTVVVMDTAKDPSSGAGILLNAALLKGVFVCASWLILASLAPFLGKGGDVLLGIALVGFCLLPDAVIAAFKAYFSGRERMELNTLLEVMYRGVFVALGLTAVALRLRLSDFFLIPAAASLLTLTAAVLIYRKSFGGGFSGIAVNTWRGLAVRGYPLMLAGLFVYVYRGLDTVIISLSRGDADVGLFSSARALTDSFLFLPAAISGALLPAFSRIMGMSPESLRSAYDMSLKLLLLAGLLLAALITIFAKDVILFVYGPGFAQAIPVLRILTWSTCLAFMNIIMTTMLYALGRQRSVAGVVLAMAVLSISLNLALIPAYGITAAAWTAVITEGVGLVFCERLVRKHLRPEAWGRTALKGAAAGAALCLVSWGLREAGFLAAFSGGIIAYGASLAALGVLQEKEAAVLKDILRPKRSA